MSDMSEFPHGIHWRPNYFNCRKFALLKIISQDHFYPGALTYKSGYFKQLIFVILKIYSFLLPCIFFLYFPNILTNLFIVQDKSLFK